MAKYQPDERTTTLIDNLFTFHPVRGDQGDRYLLIRSEIGQLARLMAENCPPSPELTLAIRSLHVASMQANAAIACNEADENRISN